MTFTNMVFANMTRIRSIDCSNLRRQSGSQEPDCRTKPALVADRGQARRAAWRTYTGAGPAGRARAGC